MAFLNMEYEKVNRRDRSPSLDNKNSDNNSESNKDDNDNIYFKIIDDQIEI